MDITKVHPNMTLETERFIAITTYREKAIYDLFMIVIVTYRKMQQILGHKSLRMHFFIQAYQSFQSFNVGPQKLKM